MKRILSGLLSLTLLCCMLPAFAETADQTRTDEQLVGMDVPFFITQEEMVIETDRYVLRIEPGVYVPSSIQDDIHLVMDTAEEILGLRFTPETRAAELGKVEIEVFNPELHDGTFPASGREDGVAVSAPDILIWGGGGWALLHELAHCLHFRNGSILSTTLNEGIATNTVYEATDKAAFPISLNSHMNYFNFENAPTEENALSRFLDLDHASDAWDCYLYGFPMVMFLKEEYGKDALRELITRNQSKATTNKEIVPILQSLTSEDFFTRFGRWYGEYAAQFASLTQANQDYERFDRLHVYPQFYSVAPFYSDISTRYRDRLILDYTSGNRYLADYRHITPTGFSGMIAAEGKTVFTFYTSAGEKLKTYSLNGQALTVTVSGAALIQMTGDGLMVTVAANYDKMIVAQ